MNAQHDFIDGSCELSREALIARVRYEVDGEFRERLARASWSERLRLRWTMRREVRTRLARMAPSDALY